jgi:hypothetical protein
MASTISTIKNGHKKLEKHKKKESNDANREEE